jgi:hypothetical protein
MEMEYGDVEPLEVILAQMDSTSAVGWVRKSNFDADTQPLVQLEVAWVVVDLVIGGNFALFSQWFAGDENDVSDLLALAGHPPAS